MSANALLPRSQHQPNRANPLADPQVLARRWHERAEDVAGPEDDVLDCFVCSWIAFNALYGKLSAIGRKERSTIKTFVRRSALSTPGLYTLLESPHLDVLMRAPVHTAAIDEREIADWNVFSVVTNSKEERLLSLFMMLYSVRCNLFHGQKSPDSLRDLELVRSGAAIVMGAVEMLLEPPLRLVTGIQAPGVRKT
jgi:hypothetical protein